jgi:hypothetical protein
MASKETIRTVKEIAREVIGQPSPTRIQRKGKGRRFKPDGRHRAGAEGGLDIYGGPEMCPELTPHYSENPLKYGATGHVQVIFKKPRETHNVEPVFHYTPEVIGHANYLLETQGKTAMEHYLGNIKEHTNMSTTHLSITESLRDKREEDKQHDTHGAIGVELQKAMEKSQYYKKLAQEHSAEALHWEKVARSLQAVLDLTANGVSGQSKNRGTNDKVSKGFWEEKMKAFFADGKPRPKSEVLKYILSIKQMKKSILCNQLAY